MDGETGEGVAIAAAQQIDAGVVAQDAKNKSVLEITKGNAPFDAPGSLRVALSPGLPACLPPFLPSFLPCSLANVHQQRAK